MKTEWRRLKGKFSNYECNIRLIEIRNFHTKEVLAPSLAGSKDSAKPRYKNRLYDLSGNRPCIKRAKIMLAAALDVELDSTIFKGMHVSHKNDLPWDDRQDNLSLETAKTNMNQESKAKKAFAAMTELEKKRHLKNIAKLAAKYKKDLVDKNRVKRLDRKVSAKSKNAA